MRATTFDSLNYLSSDYKTYHEIRGNVQLLKTGCVKSTIIIFCFHKLQYVELVHFNVLFETSFSRVGGGKAFWSVLTFSIIGFLTDC